MGIKAFANHFPGCVSLLPEDTVSHLLKQDRPLRIKLGFDPTASDLHLGHTVLLNALHTFQSMGHQIVVILGDFTACIGDPTLRDVTRPPLTREAVLAFAEPYKKQLFRFLDPKKTELHYNSTWLDEIHLKQWIEMLGKVTLAQMIERDDFRKRMQAMQPISGHEIMYPLLQAYDSVAIKADIELGGTDQTFNLMMGRTLQKVFSLPAQAVMMFPLLEGLDGVRKMSKSYGNTISIDEEPSEMYGKIMSISDDLMWQYYKLLSRLDAAAINEKKQLHPMEAKHALAKLLVTTYHHADAADSACDAFTARFSQRSVNIALETYEITDSQLKLSWPHLLRDLGLVASVSEAMRLIKQGAVRLDDVKLDGDEVNLNGEHILRIGKRILVRIRRI